MNPARVCTHFESQSWNWVCHRRWNSFAGLGFRKSELKLRVPSELEQSFELVHVRKQSWKRVSPRSWNKVRISNFNFEWTPLCYKKQLSSPDMLVVVLPVRMLWCNNTKIGSVFIYIHIYNIYIFIFIGGWGNACASIPNWEIVSFRLCVRRAVFLSYVASEQKV